MKQNNTLKLLLLLSVGILPKNLLPQDLIHNPPLRGYAGKPVAIQAYYTSFNEISRAFLKVRVKGDAFYNTIVMIGNGSTFSESIPENMTNLRGIEYYIEFYKKDNNRITLPSTNPELVPFFIPVSQVKSRLLVLSPQPDSIITDRRPQISISVSGEGAEYIKNQLIWYVNDNDVSRFVEYKNGQFIFLPSILMAEEKHRVKVISLNEKNIENPRIEWEFEIVPEGSLLANKSKWKISGALNSNYQYAELTKDDPLAVNSVSDPNGYANFSLNYRLTKDDYYFFLGPVQWTTQDSQQQQPINSFSFGMGDRNYDSKWGQVNSSLAGFIGGASFRGGEIDLHPEFEKDKRLFQMRLIGGQTKKSIEADIATAGFGTFGQKVLGTELSKQFFNQHHLKLGFVDVRDDPESLKNPGSTVPLYNRLFNVSESSSFTSPWLGLISSFAFDFAYSASQRIILNEVEDLKDFALTTKFGGEFKQTNTRFDFGYTEKRPDFFNLLSNTQGDTRNYNLNLSNSFWENLLNLQLNGTINSDNLDNQKESTTSNKNLSANISVNMKNLPNLQLGSQFNNQLVEGKPEYTGDTQTRNFSFSASQTFDKLKNLNYNLSLSLNETLDASTPKQVDGTRALNGNLSLLLELFSWWSPTVNGSYSVNRNKTSGVESVSENFSFNNSLKFLESKLTFQTGINYGKNYSQNDTPQATNNELIGSNLGCDYKFSNKISFSLQGSYSRFNDMVAAQNSYHQYTISIKMDGTL